MTAIPRDVSGAKLVTRLGRFGYAKIRQRGSHCTISTEFNGKHTLHIPMHGPIKVGSLGDLLKAAAEHLGLSVEELIDQLGL